MLKDIHEVETLKGGDTILDLKEGIRVHMMRDQEPADQHQVMETKVNIHRTA
jgi:hypothetical protein